MCETSASISFELEVRIGLGDYVFKNMKDMKIINIIDSMNYIYVRSFI